MVSYVMRATRALLHPSIRAGRVGRRSMMTIGDKIKAKVRILLYRFGVFMQVMKIKLEIIV